MQEELYIPSNRKDAWMLNEISILKESLTKEEYLRKLPNRTWSAIREKRKRLRLPSKLKRTAWNVGMTQLNNEKIAEATKKMSLTRINKYKNGEIKTWNKGISGTTWSIMNHDNVVREKLHELENNGFLCIDLSSVKPDGIAIKDGKIYAVEIERGSPNYKKYNSVIGYTDIFWYVFHS